MKLYHISRDLNFVSHFYPRVPDSIGEDEESNVPRICFATTIEGALTAMPDSIANEDNILNFFFRVYEYEIDEVVEDDCIYDWKYLYKGGYVPDALITKETWIIKDIYFEPKDSYIIGIHDIQSGIRDVIPSDIYYEAMASHGDYIGLYMDRVGERVPFIWEVEEIDYLKINNDLKELDEIADKIYRLPKKILEDSVFSPEIDMHLILNHDNKLIQLMDSDDGILSKIGCESA